MGKRCCPQRIRAARVYAAIQMAARTEKRGEPHMNAMQQNATNGNTLSEYEKLEPRLQMAVDLRLRNVSHADIAKQKEISVTPQTVRRWFMKAGLCYVAFKEEEKIRKRENKKRRQKLDDYIDELALDALLVVEQEMRKGSLKAALELLRMAGISPIQKFEDVTPESEGIVLLRKIIEERRNEKQSLRTVQNKRGSDQSIIGSETDI